MTTSTTATMPPDQRVTMVFKLLENSSKKQHVDGKMTQLDQALHVAQLAKNDGVDPETVLAALFQDIGYVCPPPEGWTETVDEDEDAKGAFDYKMHGANYLRNLGFPKKTCELVESDVMGKRYMSTINPMYQESLSSASKELLKLQGGPLSSDEGHKFGKDPLFMQKVQLVKWNYLAKVTEDKPSALETYRGIAFGSLIMVYAENQQHSSQANMELTSAELAQLDKEYGIKEEDL